MSEQEIRDILEHNGFEKKIINQLIENNESIADQIDVKIDLNQSLFPNYETPEDVRQLYEQYENDLVVKE